MEHHVLDGKNIVLTILTFFSGFIAHITANDWVTFIAILVGLATLVSYIQKIYYNWELRRDRKRNKQHHNQQTPTK